MPFGELISQLAQARAHFVGVRQAVLSDVRLAFLVVSDFVGMASDAADQVLDLTSEPRSLTASW